MAFTLESVLKESVLCQVKEAQSFDEVIDIAVLEQLVIFVQFWNRNSKGTKTKFLGVGNLKSHLILRMQQPLPSLF